MGNDEFFASEAESELVLGGKRFRVRGLGVETFIKIMQQYVLHGLVEAPFEVTRENVDRLKPGLVLELGTAIVKLTTRKTNEYVPERAGNPLAA